MTREWWNNNWFLVLIVALVVTSIVSSLIWPDATLGCSVQIKSEPSS